MGTALLIAMIAQAAIGTGLGIWKIGKGRKMEKQAISDRENYLGQANALIDQRRAESQKWMNIIEGGIPGGTTEGTVGQIPYSSYGQRGKEQVSQQVGGYLNTLGSVTKSPMEKKLMAKKFGLGG